MRPVDTLNKYNILHDLAVETFCFPHLFFCFYFEVLYLNIIGEEHVIYSLRYGLDHWV